MKNSKKLGNLGENLVVKWLYKNGFRILKKNFATRLGEIDIIAEKQDLIAFIEVKTRKKSYFPLSTVIVPSKQRKIIITAKLFLSQNEIINKACRFDVATVILNSSKYDIEYLEDAFRES